MIITIDGPAASGKSTVAQLIAKEKSFFYINTGYFYRALAYKLLEQGINNFERYVGIGLVELQNYTRFDSLEYFYDVEGVKLFSEGSEITTFLKTPAVDEAASYISLNQDVRSLVTNYVRQLAGKKSVIIEGRDAGISIFPTADLKIFLTASLYVRAKRWQIFQQSRGFSMSFDEAYELISGRDKRDTERPISPLVKPDDALIIDSSDLSLEQVVRLVGTLITSLWDH
jgi:cytidylate kinase